MKKFLLAFLIFISVTEMKISFGQTYHSFPDTMASWSEAGGDCDDAYNPTWCWDDGWHFELVKDSIINSNNYTLLSYQQSYSYVAFFNGNYWIYLGGNYPLEFPGDVVGGIREDSGKKIWFRALGNPFTVQGFPTSKTFPQDSDILIYDFDIAVGDTLSWKEYDPIVYSIDSIQLLDLEWRRTYRFSSYYYYEADFWIEGLGSNLGLFGAYNGPPFEGGYQLLCFKKDSNLLYENLGYGAVSCDELYTDILEEGHQKSISVFPNPVSDFITFYPSNFPCEKFTLTIYNSNGQQLNDYNNLHSSQLKIPVTQLGADGLYFYTLSVDNQKIFAGKFMVQR
ncbi:MAG TPA: T9SS type A sorting domain-containing protein [Chitinophagales bacterium]|nr:T9SS type A sorting domain-containing protein [Chitinophagales bacterium]